MILSITDGGGGWTAKDDDFNPFISFTFNAVMNVTSVITQGHEIRDEWVINYMVSYRLEYDGAIEWVTDDEGEIIVSIYPLIAFSTYT